MLSLVGVYRDGWRRPVETVEVWEGYSLLATVSGLIVAQLVAHQLEGVVLERAVRQELGVGPLPLTRPRLPGVHARRLRGWAKETPTPS